MISDVQLFQVYGAMARYAAETLIVCKQADAVLLGAVGGPQWSDPKAKLRPEQGLLLMRNILPLNLVAALRESDKNWRRLH